MATTAQSIPPIARGYPYVTRIWARAADDGDAPAFPEGCTLVADLALYVGAPAVMATLSTEDGSIVRIDDDTIELRMTSDDTCRLTNTTAVLDLVRTDPSPDEWLGLRVQFPVENPITAPRRPS